MAERTFEQQSADTFSRGSLKLTYDLLRKQNPKLALEVRNQLAAEPLAKEQGADSAEHDSHNKNTDRFRVTLDSFQVRAIAESLAAQISVPATKQNMGTQILAKSLLDEWLRLAQKMIEDLPEDQRP